MSGWTGGRNVSWMLDFLWMQGKIMVSGRQGIQKYWDIAERVLPDWTPRDKLSEREVVRRAAEKVSARGVGTKKHIEGHYISGRYPDLQPRRNELGQEQIVEQVEIGTAITTHGRGRGMCIEDVLPQWDAIERGQFAGRTVLLSPFDNLIRDRVRTVQFWDYDFKIEIYVPQAKRKYGYYVLSILHNDQLIGRIDPQMDRARGVLNIHAVHAEPIAALRRVDRVGVRGAIEELGTFLGANEITYTGRCPEARQRRSSRTRNTP